MEGSQVQVLISISLVHLGFFLLFQPVDLNCVSWPTRPGVCRFAKLISKFHPLQEGEAVPESQAGAALSRDSHNVFSYELTDKTRF